MSSNVEHVNTGPEKESLYSMQKVTPKYASMMLVGNVKNRKADSAIRSESRI